MKTIYPPIHTLPYEPRKSGVTRVALFLSTLDDFGKTPSSAFTLGGLRCARYLETKGLVRRSICSKTLIEYFEVIK